MPALHAEYMPVPTCPRWCDVELTFTTAPPTPAGAHGPQLVLQAHGGSQERDVDHPAGVADVDLVERLVLHGTDRVVAREVERAELLDGDGHTSLHVGLHRDVSGDRDAGPARRLEQLDGLVGGRGIDVVRRRRVRRTTPG